MDIWLTKTLLIYGTPAQFAALSHDLAVKHRKDPLTLATRASLFHVHGWPVPPNADSVTVRLNARHGDKVDLTPERRNPRDPYAWIDARRLPDLPDGVPQTKLTYWTSPWSVLTGIAAILDATWVIMIETLEAEGTLVYEEELEIASDTGSDKAGTGSSLGPDQDEKLRQLWHDNDYTNTELAEALGLGGQGDYIRKYGKTLGLPPRKVGRKPGR